MNLNTARSEKRAKRSGRPQSGRLRKKTDYQSIPGRILVDFRAFISPVIRDRRHRLPYFNNSLTKQEPANYQSGFLDDYDRIHCSDRFARR